MPESAATTVPLAHPAVAREYAPFPVLESRNLWQARFEIPLILRTLGIPEGSRVLEVGCGPGNALAALGKRLALRRLVGLDLDAELLRQGREHLDTQRVSAELRQGDVRDLPFDPASFDVVLDFGTCHHIACPEEALREIARVLTPGGRFIHETPLAQALAHPFRFSYRDLPWTACPDLLPGRTALLFTRRVKR